MTEGIHSSAQIFMQPVSTKFSPLEIAKTLFKSFRMRSAFKHLQKAFEKVMKLPRKKHHDAVENLHAAALDEENLPMQNLKMTTMIK